MRIDSSWGRTARAVLAVLAFGVGSACGAWEQTRTVEAPAGPPPEAPSVPPPSRPMRIERMTDSALWAEDLPLMLRYHALMSDSIKGMFGYTAVGTVRVGALRDGGRDTTSFTLPDGHYLVAAFCDTTCTDVDLLAFGEVPLQELGRDVADDDLPQLQFDVTRQTGAVQVRVAMAACGRPRCGYLVRMYRKVRDVPVPGGEPEEEPGPRVRRGG